MKKVDLWISIVVCGLMFWFGLWTGIRRGTVVEVEVDSFVDKTVYNFADLQEGKISIEDLQIAAKFYNKTLEDKKATEDLYLRHKREFETKKREIEDIQRKKKQELEEIKRKDKQEIEVIKRKNAYDAEDFFHQAEQNLSKLEHTEYGRGYKEGYRDAMQKK